MDITSQNASDPNAVYMAEREKIVYKNRVPPPKRSAFEHIEGLEEILMAEQEAENAKNKIFVKLED